MLGAIAVRALAWGLTFPTEPAGDEFDYFSRAASLATGAGLVDPGGRAPGAVFFYAGVFELFRPWAQLARGANVVVGGLAVWPAFFVGRRLGGDRTGLATALGVALYPSFIAFSHYLWSETLFIAIAGVGLWLTLLADERKTASWAFAAGMVWGLAALTREAGVLVAPACALWLAWPQAGRRGANVGEDEDEDGQGHTSPTATATARLRWRGAVRGAWLMLGFAATLSPWTVFINEADLPFTLVTRTSYMNLQAGNSHRAAGFELAHYPERGRDRAERERKSAELAWAYIRERGVVWPFEKLVRELPLFFEPDTFAARRARTPAGDPERWGYRFQPAALDRPWLRRGLAFWSVAAYVVVALAGAAGLVLSRCSRASLLFGLFLASQVAPAVLTFSMTRFRLPAMLVFVTGAAALLVHGRTDLRLATPGRRAVAAATVGLLACCMVAGAWVRSGRPGG